MKTLATFRVLIPEFQLLPDETVKEWLGLMECEVTKSGISEDIRAKIIVYLAAHNMVNAFKQKGVSGEVVAVSEGNLSITYANEKTTGYFATYQRLLKAHVVRPITRCG
jgi:hypothetical protein